MRTPTKKYFLKSTSNSHIVGLYLSYSFTIEPIDNYVHTPPLLPKKLYPIQRTKWAKSTTVFEKRCKNFTLWGGTYLYGLYKGEFPPPPGRNRWHTRFVHRFVLIFIDFIDLYRKIHPFNCSSKNENWIHAKSTFIDKWVAIKSRRIKQLSLFENSYLFFKIFWWLILARARLHKAFLRWEGSWLLFWNNNLLFWNNSYEFP